MEQTPNPVHQFWGHWHADYKGDGLRLGQAFCMHFKLTSETDRDKLFYETNEAVTREHIRDYFTRWQYV